MNSNYSAEEQVQIEQAYRDMVAVIKSNMDEKDHEFVRQAYELAVEAHSDQRRKSGEPYIFHPISVAKICAEEIGLGPTAVVAALLHDVVEDTPVTLEEIKRDFGAQIAKMVDGLTKLDNAYSSESPQAENFKKVLSTLVEDVRIVLIKMADRLHNMRTIGAMSLNSQLKIAAETSYLYAPLAHRLGLYAIRQEYLDLCMKVNERGAYDDIARKLQETKRSREAYINEFIAPLKERLKEMDVPFRIFGRPKSIYSIWKKLEGKDVSLDEIYDLFAIRIIVDVDIKKEKLYCWHAYSIVTDMHRPIQERTKDWIGNPKSNGYESLHTTVIGPGGRFVEVQIRSERMDDIAERGFAAHWKYKGINRHDDVYERWFDSVRDILEDPGTNAVEFLEAFTTNSLFNEEVYVYTPKGDMRTLPKGATALDFAFHIHTDIGFHCVSIRINDHIVPMSKVLENGDRVQIITNPNQKPSEDWLRLVKTGKARSKIRSAIKEERRKKGELGREALERKFKHLRDDAREEAMDLLTKHYRMPSHVELYYAIAMEHLKISDIFKHFEINQGHLVPIVKPIAPPKADRAPQRTKPLDSKPRLLINGEPGEQYDYTMASCCNPVPGDLIFAYLTANAGLKIHRSSCPNATNLMANYGYRILKAEWSNVAPVGSNFVSKLKITGIDDGVGVIERLTHELSLISINIRALSIAGEEGYFEANIDIVVNNSDQLHQAVYALKNLSNVSTVLRVA